MNSPLMWIELLGRLLSIFSAQARRCVAPLRSRGGSAPTGAENRNVLASALTPGVAASRRMGYFVDLCGDSAQRGANRAGHGREEIVGFRSGLTFSDFHVFSPWDGSSDLFCDLLIESNDWIKTLMLSSAQRPEDLSRPARLPPEQLPERSGGLVRPSGSRGYVRPWRTRPIARTGEP